MKAEKETTSFKSSFGPRGFVKPAAAEESGLAEFKPFFTTAKNMGEQQCASLNAVSTTCEVWTVEIQNLIFYFLQKEDSTSYGCEMRNV